LGVEVGRLRLAWGGRQGPARRHAQKVSTVMDRARKKRLFGHADAHPCNTFVRLAQRRCLYCLMLVVIYVLDRSI
jgi:hypothetical protein